MRLVPFTTTSNADVTLTNMDLGNFAPMANRENISVWKGTLSARGSLVYATKITDVNMKNIDMMALMSTICTFRRTLPLSSKESKRLRVDQQLSNKAAAKIRVEPQRTPGTRAMRRN